MKTSKQLAAEWGCSRAYVASLAHRMGIGANLGGRSGYRFTQEDEAAMLAALRPVPVEKKRRPRRRAS